MHSEIFNDINMFFFKRWKLMQMFADVRLLMETECYTYLQSMNHLWLPRESIESLMTSPIWVSKGWPCHENGLFFVLSGTGSRIAGFIGIVWKSRSHDRAKTLAVTKFVINHRFDSCDGQHNFFSGSDTMPVIQPCTE